MKKNFLLIFLFLIQATLLEAANNKWIQIPSPNNQGINYKIYKLAFDSTGNFYSGIEGDVSGVGYAYKSTDKGATWNKLIPKGWGMANYVKDIKCNQIGYVYIVAKQNGIFRSEDYGNTWIIDTFGIGTNNIYKLAIREKDGLMFANGGDYNGGFFKSEDYGDNWVEIISSKKSTTQNYYQLFFDLNGYIYVRYACSWIYFGTEWSTDKGITWEDGSANAFDGGDQAVNSKNHFFWTSGNTIIKSIDLGKKYFECLQINEAINCIIIDEYDYIYIGTNNGVYLSSDDGENWEPFDNGINGRKVNTLSIDREHFIYAGTESNTEAGIFRTEKPVSVLENYFSNFKFSLSPNPSSDYIEISGLNPRVNQKADGTNNIRIFNVMGEIVCSVKVENSETVKVDVSSLPPGIYFLRVGDKVEKFVVVR